MGFDVTATHVIWLVALLGLFGTVTATFFEDAQQREAVLLERETLVRERLHGRLGDGWFCHDAGSQMLRVHVENAGRVAFALSEVTVLVDGAVATGFEAEPEEATGSDLLPPGEAADFQRGGQAAEPDRVSLVTERGVTYYPVKRVNCPILTTIALTPASASMQIGGTQDFWARGYDQFGDVYEVSSFTFDAGGAGTLTPLNATAVRLAAGTASGTYALTATYGGVTGTATVTIHPGAPVSISVSPDPASVPAGGSQAFTATVLDSYGNANATAPVTWTTTAGSITSGGVLTAQTTAQSGLSVTAATTGGLSDTATVHVVPGPVSRVTLTPSSATVDTMATQAFSAAAYDAYGNAVTGATFSWSATRGSVSAAGLYTAPSTTGADTVTATYDGVSGTASVNVVKRVHVDALQTYKNGVATTSFLKRDALEVRATVRDHLGNLVQGATVTIQLIEPDADLHATLTPTTSASGVASGTHTLAASAPQGQWTARVTGISGTGLVYNAGANVVTQVTFNVGN